MILATRTASQLKPRQLLWQIYRRLRRSTPVAVPAPDGITPNSDFKLLPPVPAPSSYEGNGTFRFIGLPHRMNMSDIDWQSRELPKLWRYNLHYFDYLTAPNFRGDQAASLITSWINHNQIGTEIAWEPYPVSLRLVNWIKLYASSQRAGLPLAEMERSLYVQGRWLAANLEYHIQANHLFKNLKAMAFAGCFFRGNEAAAWRTQARRLLLDEIQEQFLADGGHYERSPMYHAICTEDVLDLLNLILQNPGSELDALREPLDNTARRALDYLSDVTMPDGDIALLNDSAMGIAAKTEALIAYAEKLISYRPSHEPDESRVIKLSDAGYYGYRYENDTLLWDCGPIGPDYQPGHGHCDALSFELSLKGRRVIVDSGVCDYEDSPTRRYARSTEGHNTIRIDGMEQSEIWHVFRVARPASVQHLDMSVGQHSISMSGVHHGYRRLAGKIDHKRRIHAFPVEGRIDIQDALSGVGTHLIELFVHFHPDLYATADYGRFLVRERTSSTPVAEIAFDNIDSGSAAKIGQGIYMPEFGKAIPNDVLVISLRRALPANLSWTIKRL